MSDASIAVAGMVAGNPGQGGATWAVLQYVLGLEQLGHRVTLVEIVADGSLVPKGSSLAESDNARYFTDVVERFGLADRAALIRAGTREAVGVAYSTVARRLTQTDVLLDIAGNLRDHSDLFERIPARLYLDLDPGFTQLWQAEGIDMRWDGHTHFATVGLRLASGSANVPAGDVDWLATLPPVVMDRWGPADRVTIDAFTTVANWRSYGSIERDGVFYGQKVHSWRELMDLPRLAGAAFMPALTIHPDEKADIERLHRGGWTILPPEETVGTPASYMAFVRGSRAEIGVAKSGYVHSACGWFSERSACYLAAGRPVLAQETGFSDVLPVGEGLLSFSSVGQALEGARAINQDYPRHATAARALAGDFFDSARVLPKLLAHLGIE